MLLLIFRHDEVKANYFNTIDIVHVLIAIYFCDDLGRNSKPCKLAMAGSKVFAMYVDDHCEEEGNEAINDEKEYGELANYTSGIIAEQVLFPVSEEKHSHQMKRDKTQITSSVYCTPAFHSSSSPIFQKTQVSIDFIRKYRLVAINICYYTKTNTQ